METGQREELETREWKRRVATGDEPQEIILRKEFPTSFLKAKSDDQSEDTRLVDFVLNTGGADRYRDTIKGEGWDLENYNRNPVVLWHHNSSAFAGPAPMPHAGLPVARGVGLEVIGDALIGGAEFYREEGDNPSEAAKFIETVYQMVKGGFLNAVSVGFEPLEWTYDEERDGFNFLRQELLEFSVVPIPADSGALRRARDTGIDVQPIYQWAVELLESGDEIPVHRARLEAVAKGLGLGRGVRFFDLSASEIKSTIKDRLKVHPEDLANMINLLEGERKRVEEQEGALQIAQAQVEHLEEVVEGLAKKRAEELAIESLDLGELVPMDDPDENPMNLDDIIEARRAEAPIDEDNAIILRVMGEEDEVEDAESEESLRFDPDELKSVVEAAALKQVGEIKRLFTSLTGKVID